jgi:hypothetical protein
LLRRGIEGAAFSIGALGEGAGIVGVVKAGGAKRAAGRLVKRNTRMTKGLEGSTAEGAGDRLLWNGLVTVGTVWHGLGWYQQNCLYPSGYPEIDTLPEIH